MPQVLSVQPALTLCCGDIHHLNGSRWGEWLEVGLSWFWDAGVLPHRGMGWTQRMAVTCRALSLSVARCCYFPRRWMLSRNHSTASHKETELGIFYRLLLHLGH